MGTKQSNTSEVLIRAVLFSSLLLGILLNGAGLLIKLVAASLGSWQQKLEIGLLLFLIWMVVTATIRAIHKLRNGHAGFSALLLAGILTTLFGVVFSWGINRILLAVLPDVINKTPINLDGLLFYGAVGLIASLVSSINLKVRNKAWGDVLEVIVVGGAILLFIYFMK